MRLNHSAINHLLLLSTNTVRYYCPQPLKVFVSITFMASSHYQSTKFSESFFWPTAIQVYFTPCIILMCLKAKGLKGVIRRLSFRCDFTGLWSEYTWFIKASFDHQVFIWDAACCVDFLYWENIKDKPKTDSSSPLLILGCSGTSWSIIPLRQSVRLLFSLLCPVLFRIAGC